MSGGHGGAVCGPRSGNRGAGLDLDSDRGMAALVRQRYEAVGEACGRRVYRLRGAGAGAGADADTLPPMPRGTGCGPDLGFFAERSLLW